MAVIKSYPSGKSIKVLFFDDIFMGLDLPNRLPFIEFIQKEFIDCDEQERYQIFLTTYDKSWFEMARLFLGTEDWIYPEFYCKEGMVQGREYSIYRKEEGFLENAKQYYKDGDLKAAVVYLRTDFERVVKECCKEKSICIRYVFNSNELKSEDFFTAIKTYTDVPGKVVKEVELYRNIVMNPLSHADWSKPTYRIEVGKAIQAVENLRTDLKTCKKIVSISILNKKIESQEKVSLKKDKIIKNLGKTISILKKEKKSLETEIKTQNLSLRKQKK